MAVSPFRLQKILQENVEEFGFFYPIYKGQKRYFLQKISYEKFFSRVPVIKFSNYAELLIPVLPLKSPQRVEENGNCNNVLRGFCFFVIILFIVLCKFQSSFLSLVSFFKRRWLLLTRSEPSTLPFFSLTEKIFLP